MEQRRCKITTYLNVIDHDHKERKIAKDYSDPKKKREREREVLALLIYAHSYLTLCHLKICISV